MAVASFFFQDRSVLDLNNESLIPFVEAAKRLPRRRSLVSPGPSAFSSLPHCFIDRPVL